MSERLLVIDCATPALSLALFDDAACIASCHETIDRGHAEALLPAIAELPGGGQADAILVNVGPGSFTGVRVGVAAAVALGFAWRVPVHGYGCLDLVGAMARAHFGSDKPFAIMMVGGHGELFWAMQESDGTPLTVQSTPIATLATQITAPLLVGSGASILVAAGAPGEAHPMLPDARHVMLLSPAQRALPPRPVYGRGADAKPMVQPPRAVEVRG